MATNTYESEHQTSHKDEDDSMEHDREERRAPAPSARPPGKSPTPLKRNIAHL